MKNKLFFLIGLIISILGCKNDLEINAPYKEIPVVYGFLDQNDTVQYIRIQKMYQNDVNISTSSGAQITDSLYFDTLDVILINIAKTPQDTFHCYRVDDIPKNTGFFSIGRNTLYAAKIPGNNNADEVYVLRIKNPKSGKVYTSQTPIIKNADISYSKIAIRTFPSNHAFSFQFKTSRNAYLYDLIIRYQYKEMNISDTNQYEFKNVDYYVANNKQGYGLNVTVTEPISSRAYLDFLRSKIPVDNSKVRRTKWITYQTYGGSYDFVTYLDLNKPTLGIVPKNTEFTNIYEGNNKIGIGIFSSRNFRQMNMGIDPTSLYLLATELPNFIN